MELWQEQIQQLFLLESGESAIAGFDDERRFVVISEDTYFVGHSVGCQTILRYLEKQSVKAGKVVLVAPWMTLSQAVWNEGKETVETGRPWIQIPIDFEKIKNMAQSFTCIFSEDDPFVPYEENRKIFEQKLGAKVIVEQGRGHFSGDDGIVELFSALEAVLKASNKT